MLSILSSLLELHFCFCREVNLLWRTLNAVLWVTSLACKAVRTTWASPWNSSHTSKQTMKWRAFSWNHRPDASMVYFHYGSLNSVKAFMMAAREMCECICFYVLFFSQGCENTLIGKSRSHQSTLEFIFFEYKKTSHFCKVFWVFYKSGHRKLSRLCKERPYWFVFPWSYSGTTTALYKQHHAVSWIIFQIQTHLKNKWRKGVLFQTKYILLIQHHLCRRQTFL